MTTNPLTPRHSAPSTIYRADGLPLTIPTFLNLVSLPKWGVHGTFSGPNAFSNDEIQTAAAACADIIKNPPTENALHPGYPNIGETVSFARNVLRTIERWAESNNSRPQPQ